MIEQVSKFNDLKTEIIRSTGLIGEIHQQTQERIAERNRVEHLEI